MSNELDKLAAEMRKMKPSKSSRQGAMDAAMAAFSAEFASDKMAENTETSEKNTAATQGNADAARPTGQTTRTTRVQTFGRQTMAKFNALTNFKPQTMMMAGTCAAALIAGLIVLPNVDDLPGVQQAAVVEPLEVIVAEQADSQRPKALNETISEEISENSDDLLKGADVSKRGVTRTDTLDGAGGISGQIADAPARNVKTLSEPIADTPSNVVTIERRIVKTPGRVEPRLIPAEYSTIERRVQLSPEKAEWQLVPGTTDHYSRVILPAEYETKTEKVLLRAASEELVSIPPVYETVKETVRINEDGSTDVLSSEIVPTIIDETVEVDAEVAKPTGVIEGPQIMPEPVASDVKKVPVPAQPQSSPLPIVVAQNNTAVNAGPKGQFTVFNGVSNQVVESTETIVSQTGEILCRVLIPAKYKTISKQVVTQPASTQERVVPAVTKDVTVQVKSDDGSLREVNKTFVVEEARTELVVIPPVYETRSERVLVEPAREEWKPGSQAINAGALGAQAAQQPQSVASVESLLNEIRSDSARIEAENRQRVRAFQSNAKQQNSLQAPTPGVVSPTPPPSSALASGRAPITAPIGQAELIIPETEIQPGEVEKFAGLSLEVAPPELVTKMETIVIQPATVEYVGVPATYETVTETVVTQEASTELVTIPAEFEWVDGEIEGSTVVLETIPAEYETVSETVVVQGASVEYVQLPPSYETVQETIVLQPEYVAADGTKVPAITEEYSRRVVKTPASTVERTIPAVTKQVTRRVVKTPSRTVEKVVPFEIKDGKTRVVTKAATVQERVRPVVPQEVTRRVIKTPAATIERTIPAVTKEVQVRVIAPQKLYLRDDDGNIVREFENRDAFEIYKANLPTPVAEKPVSTFSVDVDTASYSFMRASINAGKLPPRESIRLEEMINYFPYDYDAPKSADEPFKANVTVTSNPWNADTKLMHVGIKGYVPSASERPRSNLVFLIDTSGSMNRANKLPLLINSFKLFLNTLDEDDTVSIVAYASASGTVLEPTRVRDKDDIIKALNNLRAGGSTAGAAGLELAYLKAQENFDDEGVNRVILATDGDFNVGFSSPADMKTFIEEKRESGIFLSVLGFGMGNYKDDMMQSLAQNGNGVAAYIDNLSEAQKVLANESGSALFTIAKDVKIQVEFNPATIAEYRLIGYETRALKRQDFNNDKVDAGEIGAGHTVTAIYEMTPVGSPAVTVDSLRYVADAAPTNTGSDEYAFVKIRHKLPDADKSTLQTFPIGKRQERSLRRASDDMRFATVVSIVGQKLRGDTPVEDYSYADAIKLAKGAKGKDENGYRAEFIQLVKLIETMEK